MMKSAAEWRERLRDAAVPDHLVVVAGRGGAPTLRVDKVFLHSRYGPEEEAATLVDSAQLKPKRPVLVIGLGLGYHVRELLGRDVEVAVVEPDAAVARLAIEHGMADKTFLLGVGDADTVMSDEAFAAFARKIPQLLVHPPTARLHPQFTEAIREAVTRHALTDQRLGVAVVGPMWGGSLPIAHYIERAFSRLGHRTLYVDNAAAWSLYTEVTEGIKTKVAAAQLGNILTNFLSEWSYARVAEFVPDICIVMAQAPVSTNFPVRLAKEGIVTAFWYVENWRHLPYWQDISRFYDFFFHIQPGEFDDMLRRAGSPRSAAVLTGCDPEVHRPVALTPEEQQEFGCDVSFAGAGYYNRQNVLSGLTDYNFKLWGVGWSKRELYAHWQRQDQRFDEEVYRKIVAGSKVNVNLHSSTTQEGVDPACDAINPRVFEIAACGGFQLCDPCKGLDQLFDLETELPGYRNLTELRGRIDYFLDHESERREIAERARARALRDHTYECRAQQMLDLILEAYGTQIVQKGIRVQHSVKEMIERVGPDHELAEFLALMPEDTLFTHENVNEFLDKAGKDLPYAGQVFRYLREMRTFAEALLEQMT
jgi:spore maturation protein CgeB